MRYRIRPGDIESRFQEHLESFSFLFFLFFFFFEKLEFVKLVYLHDNLASLLWPKQRLLHHVANIHPVSSVRKLAVQSLAIRNEIPDHKSCSHCS